MDQTPVPRVSYAGPIMCLRCEQRFQSWDRRYNRLCRSCRRVLHTQPSDEDRYGAPTRRRLAPDDSAAAG